MATLSVHSLQKSFQKKCVLHDIELDVKEGEFIVILGPSGCGKSTLLRIIAGLEQQDTGQILVDGEDVSRAPPKERGVAMVFQNYALYPHMDVYKNISYSLKFHKVPKKDVEEKVQKIAELLQIKELLRMKPKQLSGGQRQRVAMGRAIIREPKLFLFDEPLSNLDAKLRTQMRFEIKNIQKKLKTTSLYVTHDQIEAMTLAHRIVIMNKGKIEQIGVPMDLYDDPNSMFVAGFIGNPPMNFLDARLTDAHFTHLALPPSTVLGVRPEKVIPLRDRPTVLKPEHVVLPFHTTLVEAVGHESLVYGEVPHTDTQLVFKSNNFIGKENEAIWIEIDEKDIYQFDKDTGKKRI